MMIITLTFLASSFPKVRLFRWVLWSPSLMSLLQSERAPLVVPGLASSLPMVFLADGGHADNTGVIPLLRRHCKLILVVDASKDKDMRSIWRMISLARAKLECNFDVPEHYDHEINESDHTHIFKTIFQFERPRCRFVAAGAECCEGSEMLAKRLQSCLGFLMRAASFEVVVPLRETRASSPECGGARRATEMADLEQEVPSDLQRSDLPRSMCNLLASVQPCFADGHVYCYFYSEESLLKSFQVFPLLYDGLRVCHGLTTLKDTEFEDEHFLDVEEQRSALRNVLHLKVLYPDAQMGDLLILRGENTHADLKAVRARLAPHEKLIQGGKVFPPFGVVPHGLFPGHSTGFGEGYPWAHIAEYAHYAMYSARCAWKIIAQESEEVPTLPDAPVQVPLNSTREEAESPQQAPVPNRHLGVWKEEHVSVDFDKHGDVIMTV